MNGNLTLQLSDSTLSIQMADMCIDLFETQFVLMDKRLRLISEKDFVMLEDSILNHKFDDRLLGKAQLFTFCKRSTTLADD